MVPFAPGCTVADSATVRYCNTQSVGTEPRWTELLTVVPFKNQVTMAPETQLRQRMSALLSPLKSATPAIIQSKGTVPRPEEPMTLAAFMSQIAAAPEPLWRQRRSALVSPLKSREGIDMNVSKLLAGDRVMARRVPPARSMP